MAGLELLAPILNRSVSRALLQACCAVKSEEDLVNQRYDYFLQRVLPQIIEEKMQQNVQVALKSGGRLWHEVRVGNVRYQSPVVHEADGVVREVLPAEARKRGMTYAVTCLVDVEATVRIQHAPEEPWKLLEEPQVGREIPLFKVPIPIGSEYCHLTRKDMSMVEAGECYLSARGKFVIRGKEKDVQYMKSMRNNVLQVDAKDDGTVRAELRSILEGVRHRSTSTLKATLEAGGLIAITGLYECPRITIAKVLAALGWNSREEMEALIWPAWYRAELPPAFIEQQKALFEPNMTQLESRGWAPPSVPQQFLNEVMPHCGYGNDVTTRLRKGTVLGLITRRILEVALGQGPVDVRDFIGYKALETVDSMLAPMLRQHIQALVKILRTKLYKDSSDERTPNAVDILITNETLSKNLLKAFQDGQVTVQKASNSSGIKVFQSLDSKNVHAAVALRTRVSTPINRDSKDSGPRQGHPESLYALCSTETPDGANCGLVEALAIMTEIREGIETEVLIPIVEPLLQTALPATMLLRDMHSPLDFPSSSTGSTVYVNNCPIAFVPGSGHRAVYEALRTLRARRQLPWNVGLVEAPYGVCIWADRGVMLFPTLPLYDPMKLAFLWSALEGQALSPRELWRTALGLGLIEYLEPWEAYTSCVIADSFPEVFASGAPVYTHVVLHPQEQFGLTASATPAPDKNQAPRNIYQTTMGKQGISTPATNLHWRTDLGKCYQLWYPQRPLVQTDAGVATRADAWPAGMNVNVAVMPYGGLNVEDGIAIRKGFLEMGGLAMTAYETDGTVVHVRDTEREQLCNPGQLDRPLFGRQANADYDLLDEDGLVAPGTVLHTGCAIIGKVAAVISVDTSGRRNTSWWDRSVVYKGPYGVVDTVEISSTERGEKLVTIRIRRGRGLEIGDKLAARCGQKGTIGAIVRDEDMPFTQTGVPIDIIVAPYGQISRMTFAQLAELLEGTLGCALGAIINATPFLGPENAAEVFLELARQTDVSERSWAYCGKTGELLRDGDGKPAEVVTGFCFYQRLAHFAFDKCGARARGQYSAIVQQPTEGRSRGGGNKFGNMERDAVSAHGCAGILSERFRVASNGCIQWVCSSCELIVDKRLDPLDVATGDGDLERLPPQRCPVCNTETVRAVRGMYAWRVMSGQAAAAGIGLRHITKPITTAPTLGVKRRR